MKRHQVRIVAVVLIVMLVALGLAAAISSRSDAAELGFVPPARPADPATLRVMTYNVRYASAAEGHENWATRAPDMAAQLAASDVDLLGTQELKEVGGGYSQRLDILDMLPGFSYTGRSRSADPNDEQMGVYYRESRLEALESGHFWLSPTPLVPGSFGYGNAGNARMVTWVEFLDELTGVTFLYLNTHFDHASEDARYRAADQVAGYLTGDAAYAGDGVELDTSLPVVVTGDFNFNRGTTSAWFPADAGQPTVDPIRARRPGGAQENQVTQYLPVIGNRSSYNRLVTSGPLVDTWETAEVTGPAPIGTFTGFGELQAGRWLDWILATPGVRSLQAYVDLYRPDGEWPSDHVPVVADLVIG